MSATEIVLLGEIVVLAGLYLAGVARIRRDGARDPHLGARALAFCSGLAVLAVALVPIDRAADDSLAAHMIQHLLMLFAAAPLLIAGAPHRLALGALPALREPASRLLGSRPLRALTHPVVALGAFAAILIAWHVPTAYDAAAGGEGLHAVEHACFLAAGIVLWLPLLAAPPRAHRLSALASVLYLMVAMIPGALIGLRLISAADPLYDHYAALGLTADGQREAGMLMVGAGGLLLAAAAVTIAWLAIEREERRHRARQARIVTMVLCAAGAITLAVGQSERSAAQQAPGATAAPLEQPEAQENVAKPEYGRELFEEGCSDCHGSDARGIEGRGPSLYGVGEASADFYLRTGRMPLANPQKQPERSESPYTEMQREALVEYVGSLGAAGPPIPEVDASKGHLAEGFRLFTELCAGCHQIVGQGGIVTRGNVPDLQQAEPIDVAEAIEVGPFVMPHFKRLSSSEVDSIAKYVLYTRDPVDAGGWGIGHIGPIPEGMVAWLLAGAALLLAIRLIGERTTR